MRAAFWEITEDRKSTMSGEHRVPVWAFPPNSSKSWSPLAHPWLGGWQSTEPTKHRNLKRRRDQIVSATSGGKQQKTKWKTPKYYAVSDLTKFAKKGSCKKQPTKPRKKLNLLSFSHSFYMGSKTVSGTWHFEFPFINPGWNMQVPIPAHLRDEGNLD